MAVFIFRSQTQTDIFGFTEDAKGSNLPSQFAPWISAGGGQAMPTGQGIAGVGGTDAVLAGIKGDGYYLARSGTVTVSRQTRSARPTG